MKEFYFRQVILPVIQFSMHFLGVSPTAVLYIYLQKISLNKACFILLGDHTKLIAFAMES